MTRKQSDEFFTELNKLCETIAAEQRDMKPQPSKPEVPVKKTIVPTPMWAKRWAKRNGLTIESYTLDFPQYR